MPTKATKTTKKSKAPSKQEASKPKSASKKSNPKSDIATPILGAIIAAIIIIAIVIVATVIVDRITRSDRSGTYEISSISDESGADKADSLSLIKALGLDGVITFNPDKTCHYSVLGTEYDCTYTDAEIISDENGGSLPYTYNDRTITINQEGNTLTFTRANN